MKLNRINLNNKKYNRIKLNNKSNQINKPTVKYRIFEYHIISYYLIYTYIPSRHLPPYSSSFLPSFLSSIFFLIPSYSSFLLSFFLLIPLGPPWNGPVQSVQFSRLAISTPSLPPSISTTPSTPQSLNPREHLSNETEWNGSKRKGREGKGEREGKGRE